MINWNLIAVIAAIAGAIFAAITYFHSLTVSKELRESKVKKAFLKNEVWSNEGVVGGEDSIFFSLSINTPSNHIFSGDITYYDAEWQKHQLIFYFDKINKNNITLILRKTTGYKEFGSAKAKLKFINPDLFQIRFSKGYGFGKDRFMPDLPIKTQIFPDKIDANEDGTPKKVLTNDIIEKLFPERNYAKAKEILGLPDKITRDSQVFEDEMSTRSELENITSDIYFLRNATLKVTTLDKQSIHSITVFGYDDKLELPQPFYPCDIYDNVIGKAKICRELLEISSIESIRTIRDSATALRTYSGAPFYKHVTYFIDGRGGFVYEENQNHKELIGDVILGFCLSSSDRVFYIYDSEMR